MNIGSIELNKFYSDQANKTILKKMILTDELLDYLGDYFQNTRVRQERGWGFHDWCNEMIGVMM